MTAETRRMLNNGAHMVRPSEIAVLRANQTPVAALVAPAVGLRAVPTTIILTTSNRHEENVPDYGLAYILGRPNTVVSWRLEAGLDIERWINGHIQRT